MSKIEEIKKLIQKIGTGSYKDGSSTKAGKLYHAIPFDEFSDVKTHKDSSKDELDIIKKDVKTFGNKSVLDIGCANGFFSFNAAQDNAKIVVGYEGDENVWAVNEEIRKYKNIKNIQFVNKYFDLNEANSIGFFDIIIMLNVHMWIYKQLGPSVTKDIMIQLSKKCGVMYFQTAHAKAKGMYCVKELKDEKDIINYLKAVGFNEVVRLGDKSKWGSRLMFKCQ